MGLFHSHKFICTGVSYFWRRDVWDENKKWTATTLHLRCACSKVKTKDLDGRWTIEMVNGT